ncbi:MAG: GlxA family transcriptional regulator [Alphaproteobacteria bacterium]|nr:GlxA family transcriptional regulator [Alphaproteobacteria bacterium]
MSKDDVLSHKGSGTVAGETAATALSVGIVPLPNFTLNAFASFIDALRLAADERDRSRPIRCRWEVMSHDGRMIPASCGIGISVTNTFLSPDRFDYVVVIGGLLGHDEDKESPVLEYLRLAARQGVALVGICTGVFAMARAGLLDGRKACVSWLHYQDMIDRFDSVEPDASRLFVADGKRITCAGGVGSARLAAWMIEQHLGRDMAQKALSIMMVEASRTAATPQPQPPVAQSVRDPRVARAILLLEEKLSDPPRIDQLARTVGISRRQLERGFREELGMSFGDFSRALRLDHGLWLVMTTDRSVLDITLECGFNGQSHFATLFRKAYGLTPTEGRHLPVADRDTLMQTKMRFKPRASKEPRKYQWAG